MGLAALGEDRKNANKWLEPLSRILRVERGSYEVNPIYTKFGGHFYGDRFTDELAKLIATIDATSPPITYGEKCEIKGHLKSKYLLPNYVDIAWAAQELLERAALTLATRLETNMAVEDSALPEDVGLNCKMNGRFCISPAARIYLFSQLPTIAVPPWALLLCSKQLGYDVAYHLSMFIMGQAIPTRRLFVAKNCKIKFRSVDNPAIEAANLLEQGRIIGWFNGGMEFGARALGARSILANPLVKGIKDKVNNEVKYREDWRPFCPSLQEEAQHKYLKDVNEASFMIVAYQANEKTRLELPSVVHVDGTVRPQVVSRQSSPLYYSLLEDFGKRCGEPIVLNTSFNVRGEPIVCTPQDAIRCFFSTGLDSVIMGSFLLQKGSS